MSTQNFVLLADAYKYSHYKLYVPGTTKIYSYLESRGGSLMRRCFMDCSITLRSICRGRHLRVRM